MRMALALATVLWAQGAVAAEVCVPGEQILVDRVCYTATGSPTGYDHAILGATPEWASVAFFPAARGIALGLSPWALGFKHGFIEDIRPVLADVTGDGQAEILVVQTDLSLGARLIVLGLDGAVLAATDFIGQRHRWLAIVGVGDLDGDGGVEIGYVDRPHLRRELVLLRYREGRLEQLARLGDLTNHRIGDRSVSGGARQCAGRDSLVLASGDWRRVIEVARRDGAWQRLDRGALTPGAFERALACD